MLHHSWHRLQRFAIHQIYFVQPLSLQGTHQHFRGCDENSPWTYTNLLENKIHQHRLDYLSLILSSPLHFFSNASPPLHAGGYPCCWWSSFPHVCRAGGLSHSVTLPRVPRLSLFNHYFITARVLQKRVIGAAGEAGLRWQPAPHTGGNNEDVKADNGWRWWWWWLRGGGDTRNTRAHKRARRERHTGSRCRENADLPVKAQPAGWLVLLTRASQDINA